ncbi:amidohydrolase family protein [Anaerovorax odorimutans]|uniref:Amidohydrolase family protein n=1 Tax=Anaerovorax odorimutans TaxID=109327 RepID=A0ABT1RTN8_9FIRM|nr:amidohydrolase family protein [Anaerovorax odorimutans]MCQ4638484.1 amidohydrolase family protein [Anaerovorax odorimutans]
MNNIIDSHMHIAFRELYPSYFINGIIEEMSINIKASNEKKMLERIIRGVLSDKWAEKQILEMDRANISKSILLAADLFDDRDYASFKYLNEFYLDIFNKHKDRFYLFLGINPKRDNEAFKMMEEYIYTNDISGIKLYPPTGFELDYERLYPIYDLCQKKNMPILVHVGKSLNNMKMDFNHIAALKKITSKFDRLKVILGHAGILYLDNYAKLAQSNKNIYLDISGFQKMISDRSNLYNIFGKAFYLLPEQLLFASDWPMFSLNLSLEDTVKYVQEVSEYFLYDSKQVFYRNIASVLGGNN